MRIIQSWGLSIVVSLLGLVASSAHAQVSLGAVETPYTQDFDSLAFVGTSTSLPTGWHLVEVGTGGDTSYTAGTGSSTTADTYSLGSLASGERAFGMLCTNALGSIIGAQFTNATGGPIGAVTITYRGEQWREGAIARADRIDFQYSTDATMLDSMMTWTDVDALDFSSPDQAGPVGAKDGNAVGFRAAVTATIAFPTPIAAGGTFWIRWTDSNVSGNDDALAVDDFSLVPHAPPRVGVVKSVVAPSPAGPTSALDYGLDVTVQGQGIRNVVLTDSIPTGTVISGSMLTYTLNGVAQPALTVAADADIGEVVAGVLTVRLPNMAVGDTARIGFQVQVSPRSADGTVTNTGRLAFDGVFSGAGSTVMSNTTTTNVVSCVTTASGTIPICVGSVAFDVFFDANGNGMRDTGESGIAGWGIALDGGASQTTSAAGTTTFANVTTAGTHPVTNTPPSAVGTWMATFPAMVTTTTNMTVTYSVPVTCTCPDDGDLCTNIPVCNAGACGAATPMDCADTNVCTTDACAAGVCTHTHNTMTCDDGMTGTRNDVCAAGACAGTAYTCTPMACETTSVPNGVDCTVTVASATTMCGAAGSCDHCDGTTSACVATACVDAGMDAGSDAGSDAGVDAASDVDAGSDAGSDAGMSAVDANLPDTGARDAGPDTGPRDGSTSDGAPRVDGGTTTPPATGGCGCRTGTQGSPSALGLGLLAIALIARRKRRKL